jgi:nitrite reductase (NADH) large subunit
MSRRTASKLFENYANLPSRVPDGVWIALRGLVLAVTIGLVTALVYFPDLGLMLFWGLAIPILPAIFVVAPGFWRQVCPMAALNQLPRPIGLALGRDLPPRLQKAAFAIAVFTFVAFVGLRVPLLNHAATWLAVGLIAVLALAFAGGILFKGRSGWCGTFCPLGPIQRFYGQAPIVLVRNGYCPTCVGCQKNCYDFSPAATIFSDLHDEDALYAGQRRFFMAMMPGLLLGYFLQGPNPAYGEPLHAVILVGAALVSTGLYQAATTFFGVDSLRMATLFAALSLIIFYAFAGPIVVDTIERLTNIQISAQFVAISRTFGALLALGIVMQARQNGAVYRKAMQAAQAEREAQQAAAQRERLAAAANGPLVVDRGSGSSFPVAPDQSLLDSLEAANLSINFGCRSGVCGADPVAIHEGYENLSEPDGDEIATLRRLGLKGKARLACVCRVTGPGPVVIDRDLHNAKFFEPPDQEVPQKDLAALGIRRVVIIGNGAAGVGVAEALRRVSQTVEITIVADEFHHFYNRMAIGRVVYGRTAMDGLQLLPDEWYAQNKIDVWRNTVVRSIARRAKQVRLATGDALSYDRLVLATGAQAAEPAPNYSSYPNAFLLRTAADAQAIRACVQTRGARRAVVIGGGVLGIEAADALRHLGLEVTILQRADHLMDQQLDAKGGAMLAEYLADMHIRVETGATVASLEAEAALKAMHLSDGRTIEGDLFVACAGVRPNVELARDCGLEVERGVLVDSAMRTTRDTNIFAVGDVAQPPGGARGLWTVAAAQAKTAVANMIGEVQAYEPSHPLVQLKCDAVDVRSFGEIDPEAPAETIEASPHGDAWWRFVLRDGALIGALYVGPPGSARDFTRIVQSGVSIAPVLDDLRTGQIGALRTLLDGSLGASRNAARNPSASTLTATDMTMVKAIGAPAGDAHYRSTARTRWAVAALLLLAVTAGSYWASSAGRLRTALNGMLPTVEIAPAPARMPPTAAVETPALPSASVPDASAVRPAATNAAPASPAASSSATQVEHPVPPRPATAVAPSLDANGYYRRGQELARNGDFVQAIRNFDEAIRLDPKHADAFNNRCWAHAIVGDLQAALSDCDRALRLQPRYADAFDSRGLVDLKLGLPKQAIIDYDDALQVNPKLASSLYGRGIAKLRTGNAEGADADILAAKLINPGIAEEFANYGIR